MVSGAWREPVFSYSGRYYRAEELVLAPKPVRRPRPTIYAGGESEAAKSMIAARCDAYVMHGDPPERIAPSRSSASPTPGSISCCCNAARSSRRWSASRMA